MIRYGSVCSGVEAASLAWKPLGWECAFVSEVEPFPCAVLHHRFGASRPIHPLDPAEIVISDDEWKIIDGCKKENPETWRKIIESNLLGRYDEYTKRVCWIKQNNKLPETGTIPNEGDFTKIGDKYRGKIDLLVGGTPCQSFSVAGKRAGLAGVSGLALDFIRLAYESQVKWVVWENVPGCFSTNGGRDFGAFLSGLAGVEIAVPGDGWRTAGFVRNHRSDRFGLAWRVLDAQFTRVPGFPFAIPQRRRRVFVVGYFGDWERAASVLLEPDRLSWDTPPCRKTRKELAGDAGKGIENASGEFQIANGTGSRSDVSCTLDVKCKDGAIRNQAGMAIVESGKGFYSESASAQTLEAHEDQHRRNIIVASESGPGYWLESEVSGCLRAEGENRPSRPSNIICLAHGQSNAEKLENCGVNLTCNHEAPIVITPNGQDLSDTLDASYFKGVGARNGCERPLVCVHGTQDPISNSEVANAVNRNHGAENCVCQYGNVAATLEARHDSSPCADRGMNVVCVQQNQVGEVRLGNVCGSLNTNSNASGRNTAIVYENHPSDSRVEPCGECCPQLNARTGTGGGNLPLVQEIGECFPLDLRNALRDPEKHDAINRQGAGIGESRDASMTISASSVPGVGYCATVRRLLPVECERLMGFPDNHTRIPWGGKPEEECPDSPRYKVCGNSMCRNVMEWIGRRIEGRRKDEMTMDYKDKLLHKRMAQAITALRKLAEAMSEYRPEWKFHEADVLIAALGIKILENQLEKEGMKK